MCTPEQLEDEFRKCLELAIFMLKTLGLYEDVSYRFSQWDPNDRAKYIGTEEQWNEAQGLMERILNHLEIPYEIGIGEAAFYGPKLDIQIKNVYGKEDTLITIQIDQMRFTSSSAWSTPIRTASRRPRASFTVPPSAATSVTSRAHRKVRRCVPAVACPGAGEAAAHRRPPPRLSL